ncbi:hypothetical protein D3C74_319660 [compost metagenome]
MRKRELVLLIQCMEKGILFHFQAVDGVMRQIQFQRFVDTLIQHPYSLVRQSEHQVNGQISQSRFSSVLQTPIYIICIMNTANACQQIILKSLNAKADTVYAAFFHCSELLRIGCPRVRFHRKFNIVGPIGEIRLH